MRPVTHVSIVSLGILSPWVIDYILQTPKLGIQILAGLGAAGVLDHAVHYLARREAQIRIAAAVGPSS